MMTARGTVDPSRWDEGIPALLLDYSLVAAMDAMKVQVHLQIRPVTVIT